MPNLVDPKNTIEVLKKYGFVFNKRFGQNFLIDAHVLDKIIAAADLTEDDVVLEVGPGIGTMTEALSAHAGKVYAVEIDDKLIPILKETLADCENVTLIHDDILKVDLKALSDENGGKPLKVVANLPYYITTPIVMGLLEGGAPVESITVMVQKEVAERMQAAPGTKEYGALSLAVRYYAEPYIAANVPPNCFMPRPDVASQVIRLTKHDKPPIRVKDAEMLFRLIRASFSLRRKTLANGLRNANLGFTKEEIEEAVRRLQKGENVRGETLSLQDFAVLSDIFTEMRP